MKLTSFSSLLFTLFTAFSPVNSATAVNSKTVVSAGDNKLIAAFESMHQAYRRLHSIDVLTSTTISNMGEITKGSSQLAYVRGRQFLLKQKEGVTHTYQIVCDGLNVQTYIPSLKQYTLQSYNPQLFPPHVGYPSPGLDLMLLLPMITKTHMTINDFIPIQPGTGVILHRNIGSQKMEILQMSQKGLPGSLIQFWIDPQNHMVRRYVMKIKQPLSIMSYQVDCTILSLNHNLPDAMFRIQPPKGATLVQNFPGQEQQYQMDTLKKAGLTTNK